MLDFDLLIPDRREESIAALDFELLEASKFKSEADSVSGSEPLPPEAALSSSSVPGAGILFSLDDAEDELEEELPLPEDELPDDFDEAEDLDDCWDASSLVALPEALLCCDLSSSELSSSFSTVGCLSSLSSLELLDEAALLAFDDATDD